uniref:FAM234A/B beta-propeller domain-containing protein n=1 Tax=Clastoptera arizonana TaxID=38151 RepID=A0A1B6E3T2_9HEMI
MGDYQPLRSDSDCRTTVRNRIKYMKENDKQNVYYNPPMSTLRAIAFSCSILVCILTICVFLWVIPCHWATCPIQKATSWDKVYYGLELKGPLSLVHGTQGLNIVAMFQSASWGFDSKDIFPSNSGGIISLIGNTGVIAWWSQLVTIPTHLDCSQIDPDKNGVFDCMVIGDSYIGIIDSLSGVIIWSLQNKSHMVNNETIEGISFPVVTPDVNKDGVFDILVICKLSSYEHHVLLLISGKTGQMIGKPLENKSCIDIDNLMVESKGFSYLYSYTCKRETNNDSYNIETLTFQEMVFKITNNSIRSSGHGPILQTLAKSKEWIIGNHRLNMINTGPCPTNCSVTVNVTGDKDQTVYFHTAKQTYGMKPLVLHFNDTISGFLLKFWQWGSAINLTLSNSSLLYIQSITESIVLLTFNGSKPIDIVNASQADVVQLCVSKICQPKLEFQTDSLLLVDLDRDGYQELISYIVTYKTNEDNCSSNCTSKDKWKLQTKVRVIRLQAEILKLYEKIEHKR